MQKLYSYNQLKMLLGEDNPQVEAIKKFIDSIGFCSSNCSLEAFFII